jgi:bacterial/archaeal transporter family-2 protein
MTQYIYFIVPILVGIGIGVQSGANTQLSFYLKSPLQAALISFATGTLFLVLVNLLRGDIIPDWGQAAKTRWWMWSGGMLGTFFITSVILIAPKIGPARLFGIIIASQLIFSIIVDHFGLLGFNVQPINLKKIIGVVLLITGAILIQSSKSS